MKTLKFVSLLTILVLMGVLVKAQPTISVKELAKIYKDKDVVVVSTRSSSDYKKVHITNAVNLYHKELYQKGIDFKGILKSPEELSAMLGKKGISPDKTVVLYDAHGGKYASRVFWALDYLGYEKLKVLDGQMDAWKAGRKPVTSMASRTKKTDVALTPDASKIATMKEVQDAVANNSAYIIDARKTDEFSGEKGRYSRKGHLPGAVHVFWKEVMPNGGFKSKEDLLALCKQKGIGNDKPIIIYCNTGILASPVYIALKYICGFENVKLYDGAYEEWVAESSNKVVSE